MEAINTPGSVPNVQSAWETFVETKCIDARNVALDIYNTRMREILSSKLPCDNDEIRKVRSDSLQPVSNSSLSNVLYAAFDLVVACSGVRLAL